MSTLPQRMTPFTAGFLIHDTSRLRRIALDQRLKPLGITRSQWWVLTHIDRATGQGFSQVELARLLDVGKVTLGGLLDRLERSRLIVRAIDAHDRRAKRVQLSRKGRALLERIEDVGTQLNRQIMRGISRDQEMRLIEALVRMKRNLKTLDAPEARPATRRRSAP